MGGNSYNSYAKGNSVHHSLGRALTISGANRFHASWNVGYQVRGHNIGLETGTETNNVIEHNLVVSSLKAYNMLPTDINVASFWITNPHNLIRYNRAAGGDVHGFWYETKSHPEGPQAASDICPNGYTLG